MKFVAIGGGATIGASAYLLQAGGVNVLVDFGINTQESSKITFKKMLELLRSNLTSRLLTDLSAVILTHAHTDHSGLLPALYKEICQDAQGKRVPPFYASAATRNLLTFIYNNILKFDENAPFTSFEAETMIYNHIRPPEVDGLLDWAHPGLGQVRFYQNSHLLGSVMAEFEIGGNLILFTGDLHVQKSPTLAATVIPKKKPDLLVIDGTHAGASSQSLQYSWEIGRKDLFEVMDHVLDDKGILLLPCFAVGRAQDILALVLDYARLNQNDQFYIHVDGQAKMITREVYPGFRYLLSQEYIDLYDQNTWRIKFPEMDKDISEAIQAEVLRYPAIVIASSGMLLPGSSSRRWAEALASRPQNMIVPTGHLIEDVREEIFGQGMIGGKIIGQAARQLNISGHASFADTLAFIEQVSPKAVVIVHCGGRSPEDLNDTGSLFSVLNQQGIPTVVAEQGKQYVF